MQKQINETRKHLDEMNFAHQTQVGRVQQELLAVISSKTQQIRQLDQIVGVYYRTNTTVSGKLFKQIKDQAQENDKLAQELKEVKKKADLQEEVR